MFVRLRRVSDDTDRDTDHISGVPQLETNPKWAFKLVKHRLPGMSAALVFTVLGPSGVWLRGLLAWRWWVQIHSSHQSKPPTKNHRFHTSILPSRTKLGGSTFVELVPCLFVAVKGTLEENHHLGGSPQQNTPNYFPPIRNGKSPKAVFSWVT